MNTENPPLSFEEARGAYQVWLKWPPDVQPWPLIEHLHLAQCDRYLALVMIERCIRWGGSVYGKRPPNNPYEGY